MIRRWAIAVILYAALATNLVFWYAWVVVGIVGGAMTTEAGPGRLWP